MLTTVYIPHESIDQVYWRGEGDYKLSGEVKVQTSINKSMVFTLIPSKGDKGDKGDPGKSAYTIAVQNGYTGSEQDWEQLMVDTYENARSAKESADSANDAKEYVQQIVDEGLGEEYYNKTEVNNLVSGKADSYNTYTKNQVDDKLLNGYYTKSAVDVFVSNVDEQSLTRDNALLSTINGLSYLIVEHHTGTITAGTSSPAGSLVVDFVPTTGYIPIGIVGYHASSTYINLSRVVCIESSTVGTYEIDFSYRHISPSSSSTTYTLGAYVLCAKEINLSPFT